MKAKLSRLDIRIDYDLKDKIEKEAEEAGITQTDFILGAVKVRINRQLLVKKKLAEWKIETQVTTGKDLRNWEHKQSYNLEKLRLNCLHGVLPASIYDNPDSRSRPTKLEDLNKPTVVPVKDEDPNTHRTVPSSEELQQMLNKIDTRMKREAPVEDENTNTDRNEVSIKSILEGIEEKMAQAEKSLKNSLKDS